MLNKLTAGLVVASLGIGAAVAQTSIPLPSVGWGGSSVINRATIGAWPQVNAVTDLKFVADGTTNNVAKLATMAANTTNPTVYFGPGTYNIGCPTSDTSMQSNISIIGAGKGVTILKLSAACSLPSNLFLWQKGTSSAMTGTGIKVSGFTLDLNGATRTSSGRIINFSSISDSSIDNLNIINGGSGFLYLIERSGNPTGSNNVLIADNYLALTSPSTNPNQCIDFFNTGGIDRGDVLRNTCVNSGMNINGTNITVDSNDVYGWGFGAGGGTAAVAGVSNVTFSNNKFHDSSTVMDSSGGGCVETWAPNVTIIGNQFYNCATDGLSVGGQNNTVVGNIAYGNGTRTSPVLTPGVTCDFKARYIDATYNGNGSVYASNKSYIASGGTEGYGFCDQSASNSNITLTGNHWVGSVAAIQTLNGSNYTIDAASREDKSLINASELNFVGDGATDNSAALSTLAAKTNSPTIYFNPGTYMIGCPTSKSLSSNISLKGAGQGITTLKLSAACPLPDTSILNWGSRSGWTLSNLTIDLNSATRVGTSTSVINAGQGKDFNINHISVINGTTNMFLIAVGSGSTGASNFHLEDNYLTLAAASTTGNHCILLNNSGGGGVSDFTISHNTCVNTGMFIDAHNGSITDNEIYGWGYGAGITTAAAANSYSLRIIGNSMHDSNMALDSDGTQPAGIETWSKNSVVMGNKCLNLYGDCLDNGGKNNVIVGNTAYGVNQRGVAGNAAFVTRYIDATTNGSGSIYSGNIALDDGSTNLKYGYADTNTITGVAFGENNWSGVTGTENIAGTPATDVVASCNVVTAGATITIKHGRITAFTGC